jgi:hypothetical protein
LEIFWEIIQKKRLKFREIRTAMRIPSKEVPVPALEGQIISGWREPIKGVDHGPLCAVVREDARSCVKTMVDLEIAPHGAQNPSNRRSAIDERTTRHERGGFILWPKRSPVRVFERYAVTHWPSQ